MPEFSSTIHIDAPRSHVWETIADLGGIQTFHPGVTRSYYTSEQTEGVGASLGPVGVWLDKLVVRRQLERMIPAVLRGLKSYVEVGEISPHESN